MEIVFIDADLVMRTQVQRTVSWCFASCRQLCRICRSDGPTDVFQSLFGGPAGSVQTVRITGVGRCSRFSYLPGISPLFGDVRQTGTTSDVGYFEKYLKNGKHM